MRSLQSTILFIVLHINKDGGHPPTSAKLQRLILRQSTVA